MTEPSNLPDIDKIDKLSPVEPQSVEKTPEEGKFAKIMNSPSEGPTPPKEGLPSPMQLASQEGVSVAGRPPTMEAIHHQAKSVSVVLGDIKSQLHSKGLNLKFTEKQTLRNKLSSANAHIEQAASQLNIPTTEKSVEISAKNPITRFLTLVSDGQRQMNAVTKQVKDLSESGDNLQPGKLLLIQTRLQKAQQELEYCSVLLGKALDIIKTLFNIQI